MIKTVIALIATSVIMLSGSTGQLFSDEGHVAPSLPPVDTTDLPENTGFIRPTLIRDHMDWDQLPHVPGATATRYDWRETGKVTSVKNQSSCGACYSFASLANFESKVLIDSSDLYDFSEDNAKECNYWETNLSGTSCSGGNYALVANLLSKKGTVLESCDPYVASDVSCNSSCDYKKTLLSWRVISTGTVPPTQTLKDYIFAYGPVYTSLYAGDSDAWATEFSGYDGSYVLTHSGGSTNHAVTIVGWDDTLSHALGTGAWIVKNSWGSSWGGTCDYGAEAGYFYIAYGSANIGQYSSFVDDWQNYDPNGELLYHDESGQSHSWGNGSTPTFWGMAKFSSASDVYVKRIEFWATAPMSDVDLYVYDDFSGGSLSNLLSSQLNNSFNESGYYSVELDSMPQVSAGDNFYVVAKFTTTGYGYPVPVDGYGPYTAGNTYTSSNGASWTEMGNATRPYEVGLRARVSTSLVVSADDDGERLPQGFDLEHNYPNPFNPQTTIRYTLEYQADVSLSVYNLLGQKVATLVDEVRPAGEYETVWNGTDDNGQPVASGIYFYRLKAGDYEDSKKMVLMK